MRILRIDFESRSQEDLLACGIYKYASDMTTEILMMGWAFDGDPVQVWTSDQPFPQEIVDHILADGIIAAWNAQFERLMWDYVMVNDFGVPPVHLTQWHCTAAQARAHALPGKLDLAARALNLPIRKQPEGTRLIRTYCAPYHVSPIPPDDFALFVEYCRMDVEVERMISLCLRDLTDKEWAEYHLNERICDRGIPVDVPFAKAALQYANAVRSEVDDNVLLVTQGRVESARARKTRDDWLREQMSDEHIELITKKEKIAFGEPQRETLLAVPDLPADVIRFTELVEEAGGATISKYAALANREIDGRVYGTLMFNGAGQTGRFSSSGAQFHNLMRDSFKDPEPLIQTVISGGEVDQVTKTLAKLVRSTVYRPEGLRWFDFSAIEGRVEPWLANSPQGEDKLDLYRNGIDPYVFNASSIYNVPMESVLEDQRQVGKVAELSMGFLGGANALISMARKYNLTFTTEEALELRDAWRAANPWAQRFGYELEQAVMDACRNPGKPYQAGRIIYQHDGGDWLWCQLPSGRHIAYFDAKPDWQETPWGEMRRCVTALWGGGRPAEGGRWPRRTLYAGVLLENCIAEGTEVLTDSGWKYIEDINAFDKVFDGIEFVTHGGLIHKSVQQCIEVDGVLMTPDHRVLTYEKNWITASQSQKLHRSKIWYVDSDTLQSQRQKDVLGCGVRVWGETYCKCPAITQKCQKRVGACLQSLSKQSPCGTTHTAWHVGSSGLLGLAKYAGSMSFTYTSSVAQLWRKGYTGLCRMGRQFQRVLARYGRYLQTRFDLRAYRQQRWVHSAELSMGNSGRAGEKYSQFKNLTHDRWPDDCSRSEYDLWGKSDNDLVSTKCGVERRPSRIDTAAIYKQTYDIKNCGLRSRFTVKGNGGAFVVHNCTQSTAADLLREAILRCDAHGIPVILHVHDEIIAEGTDVDELGRLMLKKPAWAAGLPLAGKGGSGTRYGK